MKLFKKFMVATIVVLSIIVIMPVTFSSLESSYTVQAASKIKINTTKKTLNVKQTYTLKISGTKKKVKWSTSNKKVATVNSKGKVTAKKKGTATITAKVNGKKYTCKIIVKNKSTSSTVYVTNTGKKYHSSSCSYLRKSKISISLKDAKSRKYTACSKCRP